MTYQSFDVDTAGLRGELSFSCLETPMPPVFLETLLDLLRDDIHAQIAVFLCLQLPRIAPC